MPIREEIQSLAQEIVRSYEDRTAGIAQLKQAEHKQAASQYISQRKYDVSTMLKGVDDAQAALSRELKADLAKVASALAQQDRKRQSDTREFKGELARVVAEGKAATQARLKELADIQAGARDEWQKLTATMQAKRGVLVAERPPAAVAPAEVAEVTPEMAALRHRVFAYLADHPDGTRMTELEQEFGLARVQIARVIRSLLDENKVEKRDLLYLAI